MNVYVTLAIGQTIPKIVSESIRLQDTPCNLIECATDGVINSNHDIIKLEDVPGKYEGQARSLNLCIEKAIIQNEEYFVIQDRDIVHLYETNISKAIKMLDMDKRLGCVLLPMFNGLPISHPRAACSVMRLSKIKDLVFKTSYTGDSRCHCEEQRDSIDGLTFWCGTTKLITEILNK